MSNELAKYLNSRRRFADENSIKKQVKIAKGHDLTAYDRVIRQPHRLAKRHTMDCGNPQCFLCGNPRRTHKDKKKIQEKSFEQTDKWQNDN